MVSFSQDSSQSTQRTRGASSGHFCVFWPSVTNLRGQHTWLKAIRGQISWTQSCSGRFWLMSKDSSTWDVWWVYCPRCPSYSSFCRFVSCGANQLLNHEVQHTVLEHQLKWVMIYHKMLCCKWWRVRPWLTRSINIFAEEARLEAVASSDIPSKVILSIKGFVNRPTEQDFSIWNSLLLRDMTRPSKSGRFHSNMAKWGARGFIHCADPFQSFNPRGLSFTRGIRGNTAPSKTIWTSFRGILQRDRN